MAKVEPEKRGRTLFWTILLNIGITIAEYVGGIFTGSLALISDAGHNLSDVVSLILSYIGEKISLKKATPKFSFGLKRFRVVTAFINALTLLVIAGYILFESYKRYVNPQPIQGLPMLGIAVIGLVGNLLSIMLLSKHSSSNLNLRAALLHLSYDAVSSVGVIIAGFVILASNFIMIDVIISTIIALMILWSGFDVLKEAMGIFMESVPRGIDFDKVKDSIMSLKEVGSVHDLHIWSISSEEIMLSCHICLCKKTGTDALIKKIQKILKKDFGIEHTTIQVEKENICKGYGVVCET